ncbi:COX15/CtaA family protein [Millisia brevis]|uniref:COX15/CtaA family protein n=1 Tax=Millisia brevis TaxID=264148 RepID=UPI00083477BA|nr:COX15/CtaA family protein [Millisia brevis]
MLYRVFLSLVDRFPNPSVRTQSLLAALTLFTQAGISVTGATVRVTASGLGCPTWPQCFPGSFTPIGVSEVPVLHQAVEFGNRLLTGVVVLAAAAIVIAVTRARRRREVRVYAWLMPAGTVLQAVLGGLTVLSGLLWWTVAVHLLVSMVMVWWAGVLYVKVREDDDVPVTETIPGPLRALIVLSSLALVGTLIVGTMVTGAGPHAGDKSADRTVPRLEMEIVTLVHAHSQFMVAYLALLVGVVCGLLAVRAPGFVLRRAWWVIGIVIAQGFVGIVQYFTDVPAALVVLHVAGAAAATAATAMLWAAGRARYISPTDGTLGRRASEPAGVA